LLEDNDERTVHFIIERVLSLTETDDDGGDSGSAAWNPIADVVDRRRESTVESPIEGLEPRARRPIRSERLGRILVRTTRLTESQLEHCLVVSVAAGVRIGEAVVSLGYLSEHEVTRALAYKHRLRVFSKARLAAGAQPCTTTDYEWARRHRAFVISNGNGVSEVVATDPLKTYLLDDVRTRSESRDVELILATDTDMESALHQLYRAEDARASSRRLVIDAPHDSAHAVLSDRQRIVGFAAMAAFVAALLIEWHATLVIAVSSMSAVYIAVSFHRLYLFSLGLRSGGTVTVSETELDELEDSSLPVYTVLVPLYRETGVFSQLMRAIQALDWPKAKLDVRLLLEEDDDETIRAAVEANLPSYLKIIIVPPGEPRGKPKACNYGLIHARGEYVVIYDAEDVPDPLQLKKAYIAFRRGASDLACVQCRLATYNADQNLLTRWLTLEYLIWFEFTLPGLQRLGSPIPLGGTSNHLRRKVVESVGAWDPYNVTEDADLGMRLHKAGFRTVMLDSTTMEEATPLLGAWIRQRSRWTKGYVHTWLVHMRHPIALQRRIGTQSFLSLQFTLGGAGLIGLLNPIFWALTILWYITRSEAIGSLFPLPLVYAGGVALYLGNFVFIVVGMAVAQTQGYPGLVRWAMLMPLNWVLISIATWKGVLQLFYAPSYWEKTPHGFATKHSDLEAQAQTETVW